MTVFWGVLAAVYGVLVGCMYNTNINELLYASYLISIFNVFLHPCRLGLNLSDITAFEIWTALALSGSFPGAIF